MATPRRSRSRKSSTASLAPKSFLPRGPASLRIPSLARRASNTQLSLVFAQGDASRPHGLSEDVLSRQLDGDTGGKQMGLRSRRSSSATVRTVRTTSGLRSPSPSHASFIEEDEGDSQPEAGPSTRPVHVALSSENLPSAPIESDTNGAADGLQPSSPQQTTIKQLNPKASSSWLRWNSSTPTFPRSPAAGKDKGKDKGKGRERDVDYGGRRDSEGALRVAEDAARTVQGHGATEEIPPVVNTAIIAEPNPINTAADVPPAMPSTLDTVRPPPSDLPSSIPTTLPAKSRGWWGRTPQAAANTNTEPPARSLPAPSPTLSDPTAAPSMEVKTPPSPENTIPKDEPLTIAQPGRKPIVKGETSSAQGWRDYLGWRPETKREQDTNQPSVVPGPPPAPEAIVESEPAAAPSDQKTGEGEAAIYPTQPQVSAHVNEQGRDHAAQTAPTQLAAQQGSGWSSYLYSFVVPQTNPPSDSTKPTPFSIVEPTSPVEDQKPEPAPLSETSSHHIESSPNLAAPPTASRASSPSRDTARRPSAAGWLNYLAFRASQKAVTAGSVTTAETEGRRSSETAEEVMDFSSDPDFPAANGSSSAANGHGGQGREIKISEAVKSVTPKPSQNLTIRKKRLSNASTKSGGSFTPMSSSPKGRSSLDIARDTSVPVKPGAGSSLPPPPQAPATQPNLVIPTFTTTFDRPPRSLLPVQPTAQADSVSGKGITATTTGLAWRALGAVGSYVYGEAPPKPGPESILEDPGETRGKGDGRHVGADLPRRIGLGSGSPDDGWKHVQRVVVVGVHGWFPAKMLNSVIGEPTGTSVKFANMMSQAVKQFFDEKGMSDIRLTSMPLEGEGTIDNRVDKLYKAYLSNPAWINDLRRADAIFFAAHSQGCIVTTHLISRLIAQGHIRTALNAEAVSRCEWAFGPVGLLPPEEPRRGRRHAPSHPVRAEGGRQKVAMLAMCGVHLGPLHSISTSTVIQPYLQWFENAAAHELFEFQDTSSAVSLAYQRALSMILENEVRMVLLASLNDQVVPIYGASFSTATHPLLLRALYVDGASYTQSDFMTNLLCFAFMLRNAGIDDQRLVEHLSEATAGSLTGIGHSTPYEDIACYTLAVQYLFYAGPARHPIPPLQIEPFSTREAKNDFELPWIMRALVDSPEVKDLFPTELRELKEGIVGWRPGTKALREIKRRLEPMAGRQSRLRPLQNSASSASLNSNTNNDNANANANANGNGLGRSPGMNKTLAAGKVPKSRL